MANILETIMLISFGFSWPINLVKNYKAKTSKTTSLPFLLLITAGYIAGILAKVVSDQINYVLIVYLINLLFVSLNLIVYFRNRNIDKRNTL